MFSVAEVLNNSLNMEREPKFGVAALGGGIASANGWPCQYIRAYEKCML